jgi:hypothetical protein
MSVKRDPLDKENFFTGNRQRWSAIFIACMFVVLFVNVYIGVSFDPAPYCQFLLAIGSLFILGASGDSWVKAYSVKSMHETEVQEETKRMTTVTIDMSIPNPEVISQFKNDYYNDPSYAPLDWIEKSDVPEFR